MCFFTTRDDYLHTKEKKTRCNAPQIPPKAQPKREIRRGLAAWSHSSISRFSRKSRQRGAGAAWRPLDFERCVAVEAKGFTWSKSSGWVTLPLSSFLYNFLVRARLLIVVFFLLLTVCGLIVDLSAWFYFILFLKPLWLMCTSLFCSIVISIGKVFNNLSNAQTNECCKAM